MKFTDPLIKGTLVKRYKRFLADIELDNGDLITAHCANPGSMLGVKDPGMPVWVSHNDNPKRKLKYTWEIVEADDTLIGLNTGLPNKLAFEAINQAQIPELSGYANMKPEVKYGTNSRIDLLLSDAEKTNCYVEVKNVHLKRGPHAEFPDSVTARGTKHLGELIKVVESGMRAVMLYIVQRDDCTQFKVAEDIDPFYAEAFIKAHKAGVEMLCYCCTITPQGIMLSKSLPIDFEIN